MTFQQEGMSIVLVTPENRQERKWLEQSTNADAWQWLGGSLAIDARFALDLLEGARSAGLDVEVI